MNFTKKICSKSFSKFHLELHADKKNYFIKDAIHNEINFANEHLWIYELVNTPEIQRLCNIFQLNLSYNNFPTATHTRLAHSLGVYEVCNRIIRELILNKSLDPKKNKIAINVALAAALLHDMGHGPHSHAFEKYTNFNHEKFLKKILLSSQTKVHQILKKQAIHDHLESDYYIKTIGLIITKKNKAIELKWVQDLISSQLDSDRLDYLLRDSYFSGLNYGKFNIDLIIKWAFIIKQKDLIYNTKIQQQMYINHLGFKEKANYLIANLLTSRHAMYVELYNNNYSTAYETLVGLMIKRFKEIYHELINDLSLKNYHFFYDLLTPYLHLNPKFDYEKFLLLTDQTFNLILQSFCYLKDQTLSSLAWLYQGYLNQTNHLFIRVDLNELKVIEKIVNQIKIKNDYDFKIVSDNLVPVMIYDEKYPILVYNEMLKKISPYNEFLQQTPLDLNKLKHLETPFHRKVLIVHQKLWNVIKNKLNIKK